MRLLILAIVFLLALWLCLLAEKAAQRCREDGGALVLTVVPGWACVEVVK